MISQLFNGIATHGEQSVRVAGLVDKFPDGSWQGSFAYAHEAATEVLTGTAIIHTDTKETWTVEITDTGTSLSGDCSSANFRILEGRL